jgi:hypothetical protein
MDSAAFDAFTGKLLDAARRDPDVLGVILAGSTADASRRDLWSDHDFLWVVKPGTQERYRQNLSWMPDSDQIVLRYRETAHGLNVIYDYGHLAEFAVFDPEEVYLMKANDYSVPVDKADIAERMKTVERKSAPEPLDKVGAVEHTLQLTFVGVSRYARGEKISAHTFVRFWALRRLLQVLPAVIQPPDAARLDTLDMFRRVEQVMPELAAQIDRLLRLDVLDCADGYLDILQNNIKPHLSAFPDALFDVVSGHLARARAARK